MTRATTHKQKARVELPAVPVSDCTGPSLSTIVSRNLLAASRQQLARVVFAHVINRQDRAYFTPGKILCVRVSFTANGSYTKTRLYNLTIPQSP